MRGKSGSEDDYTRGQTGEHTKRNVTKERVAQTELVTKLGTQQVTYTGHDTATVLILRSSVPAEVAD